MAGSRRCNHARFTLPMVEFRRNVTKLSFRYKRGPHAGRRNHKGAPARFVSRRCNSFDLASHFLQVRTNNIALPLRLQMLDDGIASDTSREQWALEVRVLELYRHLDARLLDGDDGALELYRDKHAKFLRKGLGCLNAGEVPGQGAV